jgi:L-ascorbate metabolism protein UlaG (beta-lactamase superfamily)
MTVKGQFVADEPMSFMLTTEAGSRIFCGGDFSISPDPQTWGELFTPRVAILGIGGVEFGPANTTELPPPDAAIAAEWLGVSSVIPVHYPPGDAAPEELRRELMTRGSPIEVVALEFGGTWTQHADS